MSTIKVNTLTTLNGSGNITVSRPFTGLSGSGASLTALNATELTSGTIPIARIADDAVTLAKMADDAIGVAQLSATGTASNSTFLRGDNSWATAGSTSASDLTSGTLPMARLSGTLPALNGSALTNLPATPAELCHFAVACTQVLNVTGTNNTYTCAFDSEILDVGSNYNNSTYAFTAPSTGLYLLSTVVNMAQIQSGTADDVFIFIGTSNRNYGMAFEGTNVPFGLWEMAVTAVADMDAGDTANVTMRVKGHSSNTVDFKAGSRFGGFKIA